MQATSATQSLVTALGAGSGIDMAALAANLAAAQFAPRSDRLTARSELLERQISAASEIKSQLLQLSTALGDRMRTGDLSPQPNVANAAVASASLVAGASPKGTYSLEVLALASSQTLASPPVLGAPGSGSLTLRFGSVTASQFTADPAQTDVTIAIASGATLADVAAAINGAGAGVTAYVANAADGPRLVLKGKDGANSGFIVEAAETPGEEGLAALAWSPPAAAPERLIGPATNARFKLDGLEMTSASNTVTQPAPGFNLTLRGANVGAPTTITFAEPGAAISGFMQDFVNALNEVARTLKTATDPQSGDLARDSGARALRQSFSRLASTTIMPGAVDPAPRTLADLGIATERDGTFRLDPARLNAAMQRGPAAVSAMFTTGLYGVYATMDGLSRKATSLTNPGSLGGSINRYTAQRAKVTEDISILTEKQEDVRANLARRFAVADSRVGAARSTLSFLQGQIDAWNAGSN